MDWRTIRFDWNHARAFLVTAEEGSFSAAGRALGLSQPTVGRQVAALEAELDVVLVERVSRGLQLTATGLDLVEHVRAMGEAATRVSLAAAGHALSLDGPITIAASELYAVWLLPPIIEEIRAEHPGISVEIVASNDASDLRRREADIAIRNFRPQDPELVARKIREDRAHMYGALSYLDELANPTTPEELNAAKFIGFDRGQRLIDWLLAMGLSLTQEHFVVVTQNQLVQWELVKAGQGIGIMMEGIGDLEPLVRRALPDFPPIVVPMWLTTHKEVRTSARVRAVFDILAQALSQGPHT